MSVNSYLTNLASLAIVRDQERAGIQRSIDTIRTRLVQYFPAGELGDQFVFGSYSRGTILPRSMDALSDIDYMIIFADSSYRPQTYLDRLKRFAELYYANSEIGQSNPTIILELNHIRFELVPAVKDWWGAFNIPAKASAYQDWIATDPKGFNNKLTGANRANGNLIKPLVRILKYWNATVGRPYESFELEQKIVGAYVGFYGILANRTISSLFYQVTSELSIGYLAPQWKREAIGRLKDMVGQSRHLEQSGQEGAAETVIKRLLPPIGGLLAG